jgi:acyl carrier protein phosphodiesterase
MKMLAAAVALSSILQYAQASTTTDTCDARRQDIERQMAIAQSNNNYDQVNGLQTALNQLNANCAPQAIAQRHADEVAKYQRKLNDRLAELKISIEYKSKPSAIAKHQGKVDEARAELERVKAKGDQ